MKESFLILAFGQVGEKTFRQKLATVNSCWFFLTGCVLCKTFDKCCLQDKGF